MLSSPHTTQSSLAKPPVLRGKVWGWHGYQASRKVPYIVKGGGAYRRNSEGVPVIMTQDYALALL